MKTRFHNQNDIIKKNDEKRKNNLSFNKNTLFSTDIDTNSFENNNINFNIYVNDSEFSNNLINLDNDFLKSNDVENIFHNDNRGKEYNLPSIIDENKFSITFQKIFPFNNINNPVSNQIINDKIYYSKENNIQSLNNKDLSYDLEEYPKLLCEDNNPKTELGIDNNEKKEQKEIRTIIKSKTTKRVKKKGKSNSFPFKTHNENYAKNGNNIKKNSKRHQNCRQKIIRNFIQDNLIYWICNGEKNKMLKKLSKKKILFDYKKYKGLKLKDIYSENIEDSYNNNFINAADGNMLIKLHFTFEEAFKIFCFPKWQKTILSNVEKRVLKFFPKIKKENKNDFFSKLKSKEQYIIEKVKVRSDCNLFKESFNQILSDFEII